MTSHHTIESDVLFPSLSQLLDTLSAKKVLLVKGTHSFNALGLQAQIDNNLSHIEFTYFDGIPENPELKKVTDGVKLVQNTQPDAIIALGGGSILDTAKLINFLSDQEDDIVHCIKHNSGTPQTRPLIAIPTTSGTGSEATHFAVVYIDKTKYSVAHPSILPQYALLIPELTHTMSPELTAVTGADAFSQAIESYWNVHSTEESTTYATKAIQLILNSLPDAVSTGSPESRKAMCQASNLAGKAINITKTTAAHALSYPITAHHGIRHGQAVAFLLPHFLLLNDSITEETNNDSRGVSYVKSRLQNLYSLLNASNAEEAKINLIHFFKRVGLKTSFNETTITSKDLPLISAGCNPDRLGNNPKKVSKTDIQKILEEIEF